MKGAICKFHNALIDSHLIIFIHVQHPRTSILSTLAKKIKCLIDISSKGEN
jgi:hypothetical protein